MCAQGTRSSSPRVSPAVLGVLASFALASLGLAVQPPVTLTALPGTVTSPVHVTNAGDGSNRLFVVEQPGSIRIYKNGALLATPFLNISAIVGYDGGEKGLLSVAFPPNYESNGFFYVYYTDKSSPVYNLTIARYHVSANADVADPASAQIVLQVPHPDQSNHNGGQLFFSPNDGYLYAGTGDGGSGGDPPNNAQTLTVMLGKLLRIDVDGTGATPCGQLSAMPYAIPASNPFAGSDTNCKEIWAYGVRNPWRFSFDRVTGDLLIGDVGQNCFEEIDFQPASSTGGENYGWHLMEGFHCFPTGPNCSDTSCTPVGVPPILEHDHNGAEGGWCAIVGGFRYRGSAIPGLYGEYVYSDNCLGDLYAATEAMGGSWTTELLKSSSFSVSSFGEDESGEVYFTDLGGKVYRIDPTPFPAPSISSISPAAVIAGDPGFALTANGTGFVPESIVRLGGADRTTTYVSATKLTADILAGDIASAGSAAITVFNPAPGGGTSGSKTLNINPTFLDVPTSYWAYQFIQAISNAGVTGGCDIRMYCPGSPATRAQMAVFLLAASQGSDYTPPACTPGSPVFPDVPCPSGFAVNFIEDIYHRGITAGYPDGTFGPGDPVTRAQMAVFLLMMSQGPTYVPPACSPASPVFTDVACPGGFAVNFIEDLYNKGIAAGCDVGKYCPDAPVTRAQMAVFLTATFSLPLP